MKLITDVFVFALFVEINFNGPQVLRFSFLFIPDSFHAFKKTCTNLIFEGNFLAYFLKCIINERSLIPELVNVAHFLRNTECEVFIEYLDAIIEWVHSHMLLSLK